MATTMCLPAGIGSGLSKHCLPGAGNIRCPDDECPVCSLTWFSQEPTLAKLAFSIITNGGQ